MAPGAAAGEATIPLVAFDCTKDAKSTCEQYSVSSFPQIKYFDSSYKAQEKSQGEEYIAYEGGRTAKAMLKFILRQDPDYIKPPFETLISNVNAKKCNKSLYITYNKPKIIEYKRTNIRRKTI